MLETISQVAWFAFNLIFVLPIAVFLLYTFASVLPLLAAAEDLEAPIYENLELGQAVEQNADGTSPQDKNAQPGPRAVSYSIRTMLRLLYSIKKPFSLLRGLGFYAMWFIAKALALYAANLLPSILGFAASILLPAIFIPLHVVWVHTTITFPSSRSFWRRLLPTRTMYTAVAPPILILLTIEALGQIMWGYAFKFVRGRSGTSSDLLANSPALVVFSSICCFILSIPANLILVRIETSLLPVDERPIISLSPAVSASQHERGYMSFKEAAQSLTWTSIMHMVILNIKIGAIAGTIGGIINMVDLAWAAKLWDISSWAT